MKYLTLVLGFAICLSAGAQDNDRNIVGKLTSSKKPQVFVMTEQQRRAAALSSVALNLDANPDEVICRKEEVGNFGSKIKVRRCRTRADRRAQAERELALSGRDMEEYERYSSTKRTRQSSVELGIERVNRVRVNRGNR